VKTRLQLTAFIVTVSAALALPLGAAGKSTHSSSHSGSGHGTLLPLVGDLLGIQSLARLDHKGKDRDDHKGKRQHESNSYGVDGNSNNPDDSNSNGPDDGNANGDDQGNANGDDQNPLAASHAPTVGKDLNAVLNEGSIRIKLPGSSAFVPLGADASIPVGSVVDAKAGTVTLTSAHDNHGGTQSAAFKGSIFKVTQKRAAKPVTILRLRGGDFGSCHPAATAAGIATIASVRRRARRSLWGSGHGRFRTIGRHGAATVRGTIWRTTDRCDGTLVRVRRGLVKVRDFSAHKTVFVSAGHRHLARAKARHTP
jgi:hypothetical protein